VARRVVDLRSRLRGSGPGEGDARAEDGAPAAREDAGAPADATPAGTEPAGTERADAEPAAPAPRPRRRRAARAQGTRAGATTPKPRRRRAPRDPFSERLRTLEREIDAALAGAGGDAVPGAMAALQRAGEDVLGFYGELARAFVDGGLEGLVIRLRMVGTADVVDEFGYDEAFHARVAPLLRLLYERWWRVEAEGIAAVPAAGRALVVANHSGGLFPYDGLMIAHALREHHPAGGRDARVLVEDWTYHFPVLGPLLARAGVVRASAANAERLLEREQAIVVFPEGAKGAGKYYRDRYRLQRFARGGFVRLALRTGAPLVPVAVIGAEEIHPVLARWQWVARVLGVPYFPVTPTFPWLGMLGLVPLPTKWRLVFGPPIELAAEHGPDAHEDDLLVNRLTEAVRERVQRMIIEALRARDSVFVG